MEPSQVFFQHISTTIVIILVGFLTGGGLGILFAWLLRSLYKAIPGLRPGFLLFPWRTLLFTIILFFGSPMAFLVIPSVKPELSAAVYPAVVFSLIVLFFVADAALSHWLPVGLPVRLAGLARTFAIACGVIVAIGANAVGLGILRDAQKLAGSTFTSDAYWAMLGVVMGLGLLFDLVLGLLQMLLLTAERRQAARMN